MKFLPYRDNGPAAAPFNAMMALNELRTLRSPDGPGQLQLPESGRVAEPSTRKSTRSITSAFPPTRSIPLAKKYMSLVDSDDGTGKEVNRYGHLMGFRVDGPPANARKVYDGFKMIYRATDLGRIKSVATIPAVSTHQQQGEEARRMADVPPQLIRLCVGAENPDDVIADLEQALKQGLTGKPAGPPPPGRWVCNFPFNRLESPMMEHIRINGGPDLSLRGNVRVSGSKNAVLPAIAAALLTEDYLRLTNVPLVRDVYSMLTLMRELGAETDLKENALTIRAKNLLREEASYDLVQLMRASILVLGPLVARFGKALVALPGGCAIGSRPIDLHMSGLQKLGATHHPGARLHQGRGPPSPGGRDPLRKNHRRRDGKPGHGRRPGQGRDDPPQLRPRARSPMPLRAPGQDGRENRRHRRGDDPDHGRGRPGRGGPRDHPRPHRGRDLHGRRRP